MIQGWNGCRKTASQWGSRRDVQTHGLFACPFCGKSSTLQESAHYRDRYYVECNYCLVRTDDCRSQDEATGDWNTRYFPEGCTPADARHLREANHALSDELTAAEQLIEESGMLQEAERLINEIRKIIASTHLKHAVQEVLIFIKQYKQKHHI